MGKAAGGRSKGRRRAEERHAQLQKLEAVGRLAGGVAHDFKNLLTVVKSCSEALARSDLPPESKALVGEIADAARRGAALTRQLLTFSRRQPAEPQDVDLNALVDGMRPLLSRLVKEDVCIETELAERLPRVRADPSQLEQVLVNLVANARDALPGGGTVVVSTALAMIEGPEAAQHRAGPFVVLSVADEGLGMEEEVLSHLFEPFFTTKEPGAGTGLGLATVFGIAQQAGGFVAVDSAPGRGTRARVYLPAAAARAGAPADPHQPPRPRRAGPGGPLAAG